MDRVLAECIARLEDTPSTACASLLARLHECRMLYVTEPLCANSAFPYERTTMLLFELSRTCDTLRASTRHSDAEHDIVLEMHEKIDEMLSELLMPLQGAAPRTPE